jgi:hypothetical protein
MPRGLCSAEITLTFLRATLQLLDSFRSWSRAYDIIHRHLLDLLLFLSNRLAHCNLSLYRSGHLLLLLTALILIPFPELLLPLILTRFLLHVMTFFLIRTSKLFNSVVFYIEILCDRIHYLFVTLELLATRALLQVYIWLESYHLYVVDTFALCLRLARGSTTRSR